MESGYTSIQPERQTYIRKHMITRLFWVVGLISVILGIFLFWSSPASRYAAKWIMPYPEYFRMYASCGVADKEAWEFKSLNDRYGKPGNPCVTYDTGMVGVWVLYPLYDSIHFLQLSLEKTLSTNKIQFNATLCVMSKDSMPDEGNPIIKMELPLPLLEDVVAGGLSYEMQKSFLDTAKLINWKPINDKGYTPLPLVTLKAPKNIKCKKILENIYDEIFKLKTEFKELANFSKDKPKISGNILPEMKQYQPLCIVYYFNSEYVQNSDIGRGYHKAKLGGCIINLQIFPDGGMWPGVTIGGNIININKYFKNQDVRVQAKIDCPNKVLSKKIENIVLQHIEIFNM